MRWLVKPKLRRTGTPERANRDFERAAPFLFRKPKGLASQDVGPCLKVTVGEPEQDRAILYLHGGAFVTGSRRSYLALAGRLAKRTRAVVYLADYPKLQKAPFPAAPEAVLAAWDYLIEQEWQPHQIVIAGDSAGGNLVFGLLARLLARGQRPAGVAAFSPWGDLTLSGETITTNAKVDPLIPVGRIQEAVDLYLDGENPRDIRASPVFADYPNPPPVLIQVGAEEVLLSDSERLAALTGATLEVWPSVPHVWQIFDGRLPEANAAMRKAAAFIQTSFESAKR
ncbi:alpha/beta hydrolase [Octadecabacter sp. 1_MG-2023]|uniref:alpha/beta hydrolase n=1 Tax=unclassified Octadecabacter TaxID=196158 RepID=UPI001C0A2C0D|nr:MULTISPECIES: alpha/beta hydrolase [unclassified Octadecabacter]MBU2991826.1 alpha/beta hydrolase [Octadecabacter sp. B2R22]MDO6735800.1 alpha/beta hydrolase [Octadecabacter sp. 1_MG-2023]